ncbi:response regulator transcription factor [Amphritea sp. HPY]|uniref:response regulator transcription factor n=1 Tax=Amphritea sp. HPY TaxID=3421652 RepID=UPI003D7DE39D
MDNRSAIPVYLVDDDHSVREALRYVLEGYGLNVSDFDCGETFLNNTDLNQPGCLILDSRMPGLTGQEVHEKLNQSSSCLDVIFLTGHGDMPMAIKAFRDGACDFFQKPVRAADILPSIEKAQLNSTIRCQKYNLDKRFATLTVRENQLFDLVVAGLINKQIADQLCISVRTVEVHRAKMMERLGASSITELIKIAEMIKH